MRTVIYLFKQHQKINGTLFYCFEYFLYAKKLDPNVRYAIYDISDKDLQMVKDMFQDRYLFDPDYLRDIISVNSIKALYDLDCTKVLILDIHTLENLHAFLRADIVCYSNDTHSMLRSEVKKITYYGFYDYQRFDHQARLKLNFESFRPLDSEKVQEGLLVSSRLYNYRDIQIPEELKHLKLITKKESEHHQNIFEIFDTLYYYHSAHDTNNRLIPECFFYKKKIILECNGVHNDSIYLRYADILENGLGNYTLDASDPMLRDFLS